jgi:hypothetical protein
MAKREMFAHLALVSATETSVISWPGDSIVTDCRSPRVLTTKLAEKPAPSILAWI